MSGINHNESKMTESMDDDSESSNHQKKGRSQLELFFKNFHPIYQPEFFSNFDGGNFVTIHIGKRMVTFRLGSRMFSDFVIKCLREFGYRGGQSRKMAESIIDEFHGNVVLSGIKKKVHIRASKFQDIVLIDLADKEGRFVEIDRNGFRIKDTSPVSFLTLPKQLPLPIPEIIPLLDFLEIWKKLFNFRDENAFYMALAYVVKILLPSSGANPILLYEGPQGSGKSTASSGTKRLVDPTEPMLLSPPKCEQDVLVMASNGYLLSLDNLSYLSPDMSDVFCRVATGGGISHRKLYTDDDEKVYDIARPVIFNGIEELTERPDFIERALILHLKPISKEHRISESEYWKNFEELYPKLLGGIYTLVSQAIKHLPDIRNTNLHRMTEFHRVGLTLDRAFGFKDDYFTEVLNAHHDEKFQNIFQNDLFCQTILQTLEKLPSKELKGTISELMDKIFKSKHHRNSGFLIPKSPRQFSGKIQRHKMVLESNGIEFGNLSRTSKRREMFIRLRDESMDSL